MNMMATGQFGLSKSFRELLHDIRSDEPTPELCRDWSEKLADLCETMAMRVENLDAIVGVLQSGLPSVDVSALAGVIEKFKTLAMYLAKARAEAKANGHYHLAGDYEAQLFGAKLFASRIVDVGEVNRIVAEVTEAHRAKGEVCHVR